MRMRLIVVELGVSWQVFLPFFSQLSKWESACASGSLRLMGVFSFSYIA